MNNLEFSQLLTNQTKSFQFYVEIFICGTGNLKLTKAMQA